MRPKSVTLKSLIILGAAMAGSTFLSLSELPNALAQEAAATPTPLPTPPPPTPLPRPTVVLSVDDQTSAGPARIGAGVSLNEPGQQSNSGGSPTARPASTGSGNQSTGGGGRGSSGGGPVVPVGPQPVVVCEEGADGPVRCHVLPPEAVDAAGAQAGNIPEGGFFAGDPADPAEPAPYVPSVAEIQATILAAYNSTPWTDFELKTAPPGDLNAPLITQLETFLWVNESQWQPISATASIPGYLTVTITAHPVKMIWSGGESGDISCIPPGVPWTRGAYSDCLMTYKSSSATNEHTLTLTTTWDISYTCSAYCTNGTLPSIERNNTRPVRVAEIQSIVTSSG